MTNTHEMLKLQRFNPKEAGRADDLGISKRKFSGVLGNVMSVDVLEFLLDRVLFALDKAEMF